LISDPSFVNNALLDLPQDFPLISPVKLRGLAFL